MKSIVLVVQNLLKPYIDNKDKTYASNIAPVEVSPSEHAYAVGKQLIFNGILYDVTSAIAVNDALTVGTNIAVADNVSDRIGSIKHDYVGLYGQIAITTPTDLNTLTSFGNYYKAATDFSVSNAPPEISEDIQSTFRLTVEKLLGDTGSGVKQTIYATTGEVYSRIYGGASWEAWQQAPDRALIDDIKDSIAPSEDNSTLSKSYAIGEEFYRANVLYKAKVALTSGTAFSGLVLDTDYEEAPEVTAQIGAITNKTLAANATSVEFDVPTSGDNLIEFFSSDGADYTAIDTSVSGKVTLTYEAVASSRTITCRIAKG